MHENRIEYQFIYLLDIFSFYLAIQIDLYVGTPYASLFREPCSQSLTTVRGKTPGAQETDN